jgi:hypothetical protein
VTPRTLVQKVIKENHNPTFVAHPGVRTHDNLVELLVALHAEVNRRLCEKV